MTVMNYLGVLIAALTLENGGKFCGSTFYFVPIGLFVGLGLTRGLNLVGMAKKKEKKIAEASEPKKDL
jgi:hypothetical protein